MNKDINHKLLVILAFGIILTFGIIINLKGIVNPMIQDDYGINYSQLGTVVAFYSIGSILATFFSGILVEKFGLNKVFLSGLLISAISLLIISHVNTYFLLILVMVFIGIGLGSLNVSGNSLASLVFTKNKGQMMNIFHLFFGVGGILAPIYASRLFKLGFKWEATYSFGTVLIICLFLFSLFCEFPNSSQKENKNDIKFLDILQDPRVVIFILMFLFHVGVEVGIGSWLGVYLDDVQGRSDSEISFYFSLFFVLFTLGRFLASIIVEKVGYLRMILLSSTAAGVTILLALIGPKEFTIFFSLAGLFLSINFPTMQAAMFEIFNENLSSIVGVTLTAGSLGNIIFANWVVGFVNDLLGIKLGLNILIIYLVILVGLTYYLKSKYITEGEIIAYRE